jgi:hypothetical protein
MHDNLYIIFIKEIMKKRKIQSNLTKPSSVTMGNPIIAECFQFA